MKNEQQMRYKSELTVKIARLYALMDDLALDGCYIKRQDNFAWLSCGGVNFVAPGETGNCGLLVLRSGERYAITNNIEAPRMEQEEHLSALAFRIEADLWHRTGFESAAVRRHCKGRIGCDYQAPFGENIAQEIQPLRYSLTDGEVERYLKAGAIVSRAVEETAAGIRPGDTETAIAGRLIALIFREGLSAVSVFCAADERIDRFRHPIPTRKAVEGRVQLGGNFRYRGLTVCLTRFVNLIPLTEALRAQFAANAEIDCTMIANTIPGTSYQRPFLAGRDAYAARGYADEFDRHHQGGPIGYQPRDCRVDFDSDSTILPNQAFCWNPSITGSKSEDTIIATENGPVFVTRPILFPVREVHAEGQTFSRAAVLEL
ncbi:MAG: M24 family metallopeptidase [Candidatus Aphodomorpha sp.]